MPKLKPADPNRRPSVKVRTMASLLSVVYCFLCRLFLQWIFFSKIFQPALLFYNVAHFYFYFMFHNIFFYNFSQAKMLSRRITTPRENILEENAHKIAYCLTEQSMEGDSWPIENFDFFSILNDEKLKFFALSYLHCLSIIKLSFCLFYWDLQWILTLLKRILFNFFI